MAARGANPWPAVAFDAWALGLQASTVIGLRTLKLMAGGAAAEAEAARMVSEKVEAAWALQVKAATGALGYAPHLMAAATLAHYGRAVRANRRRLTK